MRLVLTSNPRVMLMLTSPAAHTWLVCAPYYSPYVNFMPVCNRRMMH